MKDDTSELLLERVIAEIEVMELQNELAKLIDFASNEDGTIEKNY